MAQILGFVVLLALFLLQPFLAFSALNGFRLAKHELLRRSAKTRHLVENSPSEHILIAEVQTFTNEYIVHLTLGSPPVSFLAFPSTVSDLTWTQCQPCLQCFNQTIPIYDSSKSSSFSKISCNQTQFQVSSSFNCTKDGEYVQGYFGGYSQGALGTETFTFGTLSAHGIVFGCGNSNTAEVLHGSGIVGLGRGSLSLVSQLNVKKFSYCLPVQDESNGWLFFGSHLHFSDNLKKVALSTPLIQNAFYPSRYYLSLEGITLGGTRLQISTDTFKVKEDGTGGCIISTGSAFPILERTSFQLLKEELRAQLGLHVVDGSSVGFDTCFFLLPTATIEFPKLIYNFDGADFEVDGNRYLRKFSSENLLCLMIFESNDGLSIFGNIYQQNFHMLYDLEKEMLSFAPAYCSG